MSAGPEELELDGASGFQASGRGRDLPNRSLSQGSLNAWIGHVLVYAYIYIYILYICMYIIYVEREREKEREDLISCVIVLGLFGFM